MSYEPLMDGKPATNVYTEHVYKIRATFAASSELTFRSKDATIAKTTTTTFTVTLPKPYAEITEYYVGRYAATGTDGLEYIITDKSTLATAGTLVLTSISTNSAGTATAPADGDVIYITLGVSCDTLNDKFTG
jgi:hypothetical protein